ncbi:DeoR/GlpR family DNA-binding transcription regulator [Geodermatophilus sp. SYSU D00703]
MSNPVQRKPVSAGSGGAAQTRTAHHLRPSERHDAITELVLSAGSMRIEELAERFGVSTMTVHRDLDTLEARGILRKSRGVVTAVATSLFESSPEYRDRENRQEKQALARAAFTLVEPGQAVILDDSTTGLHLAHMLPQRQPLTVITNFQRAITELVGHPGIALIALGGQHYQWCDAYMGSVTLDALRSLRADILFMSTPAITDDICFHQHHDAALVKRAMFESAATRVLMVDHSKFTKRALHAHIAVPDFDVVVVDAATSPDDVSRLRDKGVTVLVADADAAEQMSSAVDF